MYKKIPYIPVELELTGIILNFLRKYNINYPFHEIIDDNIL